MFKFNNGCSSPQTWFVVRSMLSQVGQTLNHCWFNGGPPSATLVQHQTNLVSTSLIDLLLGHQPTQLSEVGRVPATMCRSHSESCCRERRNLPKASIVSINNEAYSFLTFQRRIEWYNFYSLITKSWKKEAIVLVYGMIVYVVNIQFCSKYFWPVRIDRWAINLKRDWS